MKQTDSLLLRRLHHDVLTEMEAYGEFATVPVRPALDPAQQLHHFGCMRCQKRSRTKSGEGVHLFRVHGIVAQERRWCNGTACEACLKEFHTHDKLQVHLRTATACRSILSSRPFLWDPVPGFGSTVNNSLRLQHDGLLPVQRALGPLNRDRPHRDIESHHRPLFEALTLALLDFSL